MTPSLELTKMSVATVFTGVTEDVAVPERRIVFLSHATPQENDFVVWMKLLHELDFIAIKPGKSGAIGHVLIWNPHLVIRDHHEQKTPGLVEATYNMLLERALEIGVKDMTEAPPEAAPATAAEAA